MLGIVLACARRTFTFEVTSVTTSGVGPVNRWLWAMAVLCIWCSFSSSAQASGGTTADEAYTSCVNYRNTALLDSRNHLSGNDCSYYDDASPDTDSYRLQMTSDALQGDEIWAAPGLGFTFSPGECSAGKTWDATIGRCKTLTDNKTAGVGGGAPKPSCPSNDCGDPINTATGNEHETESDFIGSDLLRFERTYNSEPSAPSHLLGPNWVTNYDRRIETVDSDTVIVRRGDGAGFSFELVNGVWQPPVGVITKLAKVVDAGGNFTGWTYVENGYLQVENFDTSGRLTSILRSNGEAALLVYNNGVIESGPRNYLPSSVTDQSGRKMTFSYDTNYRLTQLVDPTGALYAYTYDANGRLSVVTYPGGATKTYLYNDPAYTAGANLPYALTAIRDEKNTLFIAIGYYADGRARWSEHLNGIGKFVMTYNADGTTSIQRPSGVVQQRSFNHATTIPRASGITEAGNGQTRTRSLTYDAKGFTDIETDATGVTTDYNYNAQGLLTQRIDSANQAATKRTTQTDWNTTFNVPTERRLLNASNALEEKRAWTYNSRGQVVTATLVNLTNASLNRTTTYTYCESAGVTAGTCPRVGVLLSVDGPRTDVVDTTTLTYRQTNDASCTSTPNTCPYRKGDLWKTTNALGQVTEILAYDGAGRSRSIKDANGVITDLEYSPRGWLTARKVRGSDNNAETDDAITLVDYDPTGEVSKVTLPDGSFTSFIYDSAHRLTDVGDAQGNSIHYTLNNSGERVQEDTKNSTPSIKRTLYRTFDTLGQLDNLSDAYVQSVTHFTHDLNGNLDTATDPLGRVIDNDYDPLGRVIQSISNVNGSTSDRAVSQFQYDARDNLRTVIDPKGLNTNYTYDSVDNLVQLDSPDTGTTAYGYDLAGNRTSEMRADNWGQDFVYDALNRLTTQTFTHAAQDLTFTYDATQADCATGETYSVGRLTKIADGSGNTRYCYDQRGHRVRQVQTVTTGTTLTVGTTYDASDRLLAMTYPSGAIVNYQRDSNGRISRIDANPTVGSAQVTLVSSVTYLPYGPLNVLTFGNGRVLTKSYDQNYAIDSVADSATTNPISEDFTLDLMGNVSALTERTNATTTVARNYTYDGLDRVTAQKDGDTVVEGFTYNSTGDRLSKQLGTTANWTYTYPGMSHRLSAVGATPRSYNATGETTLIGSTASAGKSFAYDDRHRLATFLLNNQLQFTNYYNAFGARVSKVVSPTPSNSRQFIYDEAGHLLGEYTTAGARVREYVWLDDTLVAVLGTFDGTTYQFVETDHLGTPRAVVQPVKNVVLWRMDIHPTAFGDHAPVPDPDGDGLFYSFNLRFRGQYYDSESNQSYNYFRNYDLQTGRYLESDPIGLAGGWSTYGYVSQHPLNSTDPLGLIEHNAGRWIDCGAKCRIRIDTTIVKGVVSRHLHWECKGGPAGECGENGAESHGGTWADAPSRIKECALKAGFNGAFFTTPESQYSTQPVEGPNPWLIGGAAIGGAIWVVLSGVLGFGS